MSEETVSKSKQKREQRQAEAKAAKSKKNFDAIITWVAGIAIAIVVVGVIIAGIVTSAGKVEANGDYSEGLTAEGFVKGAKLDSIDVNALESIIVPYSEVEFTEDEITSQINELVSEVAYYSTDADLTVEDGSEINLDYVGSMDGVEFEGGSTNGNGAALTIGSKTFIDTFEEQLIGAHPGDHVTVNVTFPDPYENNPDFAGKAAVFECTVNSIKVTPEFNDEFVAQYLSEKASTTDEFRAYVAEVGYQSKLKNYIANYINNNSQAKAPKSYIKHLKGVLKFNDEQAYEYYNNYFYQMLGYQMYDSFNTFTGKSDDEYNEYLKTTAEMTAAADLTYEAYFKAKGLAVTEDQKAQVNYNYGNDAVAALGEAFYNQEVMKLAVVEHLADIVFVEGK